MAKRQQASAQKQRLAYKEMSGNNTVLKINHKSSSSNVPNTGLTPNTSSLFSEINSTTQNRNNFPTLTHARKNPSSQGSSATRSSSTYSTTDSSTNYKKSYLHTSMNDKNAHILNSPYLQPVISLKNPCLKNNQQLRNIYKSLLPVTILHSKEINNAINRTSSSKRILNNRMPNLRQSAERKLPSPIICEITMKFMGGHSPTYSSGRGHQIRVYQQRTSGNPVNVYTGCLDKGETFSFLSKRQHGYPFSITLYVNGMLIQRLSTCCEYKHQQGRKLGGSKGQFVLTSVKGSFPCYRCQTSDHPISPPPASINDDDTMASSSSSLQVTNDESQSESENAESEYEDDFEEGDGDSHTSDSPVAATAKNETAVEMDAENKTENVTAREPDTENEKIRELKTETKDDDSACESSPNGEIHQESPSELVEPENSITHSSDVPVTEINLQNENKDEIPTHTEGAHGSLTTAENKGSSELPNEQFVPSDNFDYGNPDLNSSSDNEDSTTNDDAEASVTSQSESNGNNTDDDVICQEDNFQLAFNEHHEQCIPNPLLTGAEWMVQASPCREKQWMAYREKHQQQFDSSDEECVDDCSTSPRVTVKADVHASDFESPRTTQIIS